MRGGGSSGHKQRSEKRNEREVFWIRKYFFRPGSADVILNSDPTSIFFWELKEIHGVK
jgi:hypothetical protein